MTDLTPEAAALFEQARTKHDPSDAECAQTLSALHARLGIPEALASAAVVEMASSAAASAPAAGALFLSKVTKLVLATVVLGSAATATVWHGATRGSAPPAAPAVQAATTPPAIVSAPLVETPPAVPAPREIVDASLPRARTRLGERSRARAASARHDAEVAPASPAPTTQTAATPSEIALIRGALTSLRQRDPSAALRLLESHATYYPTGLFAKEREGTRVLALCAAGRSDEGRKAKAAFLARSGSSPIAARVELACREGEAR